MTSSELKEIIEYNALTGKFMWKTIQGKGHYTLKKSNTELVGYGTVYKQVSINGKKYRLHQLAFLYVHGYIPKMIDHINGDGGDNRLSNIRDVASIDNQRNLSKAKNNTSGTTGVYWNKHKQKWDASIQVYGKKINLGRFSTKEQAIDSRKEGEVKYGFHDNHGR